MLRRVHVHRVGVTNSIKVTGLRSAFRNQSFVIFPQNVDRIPYLLAYKPGYIILYYIYSAIRRFAYKTGPRNCEIPAQF